MSPEAKKTIVPLLAGSTALLVTQHFFRKTAELPIAFATGAGFGIGTFGIYQKADEATVEVVERAVIPASIGALVFLGLEAGFAGSGASGRKAAVNRRLGALAGGVIAAWLTRGHLNSSEAPALGP